MNDIELYLSKSNDRKSVKEGKNLYEIKADLSRKSSLTLSQTLMYVEKLSRRQESEKIRTLCGFA